MNRIITVFIAVFFSVLLLSCSKNDDKDNGTNNPLIGRWFELEVIGEREPLNDCEKQSNYTFSDNQATVKMYDLNSENACVLKNGGTFTYTLEGDKIKVKNGADDEEIRYVINNGVLSLFHPQGNGKFVEIKYIKK